MLQIDLIDKPLLLGCLARSTDDELDRHMFKIFAVREDHDEEAGRRIDHDGLPLTVTREELVLMINSMPALGFSTAQNALTRLKAHAEIGTLARISMEKARRAIAQLYMEDVDHAVLREVGMIPLKCADPVSKLEQFMTKSMQGLQKRTPSPQSSFDSLL